jgi:DNA topoisomerase I
MLGKDPDSDGEIMVKDGRYGPYVTDGTTNASLPKSMSVESINLGDAVELLARKRTQPKRAWKGKRKAK